MSELLEILSTKPCASFSVDGKRQNQMSYRFRKNRRTHLAFGIYYSVFGRDIPNIRRFFYFCIPKNKNKKRKKRGTVFLKKPENREERRLRIADRGTGKMEIGLQRGQMAKRERSWKMEVIIDNCNITCHQSNMLAKCITVLQWPHRVFVESNSRDSNLFMV